MTISATMIADSYYEWSGKRLCTMELRYPRFIHAEFMTHRVFSRNASSSRAIPVQRLIDDIIADTAMPSHWGRNQPGMQAREEHDAEVHNWREYDTPLSQRDQFLSPEDAWINARDQAIRAAEAFHEAGYHKQIVNRLLEPFSHINVVVSSTEWKNFFALRDHPDAQPEIRALAQAMKAAMEDSSPRFVEPGHWHIPYLLAGEKETLTTHDQIRVSVARCARVSYKTHDGRVPETEEDLALYERLASAVPPHLSPLEHQATPDDMNSFTWGNFDKWTQYRRLMEISNGNVQIF